MTLPRLVLPALCAPLFGAASASIIRQSKRRDKLGRGIDRHQGGAEMR